MATIGPYTLHTIETGRFRLDGGAMFGIVPKPLWERRMPADERNRILLNMRCLLLAGNGCVILIDNGIGDTFSEKFRDIYGVDHGYAELHASLDAAGFSAGDITDVILSHLHFDHCGGATVQTGDGYRLTFPQARHYVQQAHWEWARRGNPKEDNSFLDENLDPLEASGQLVLVEGETALFPHLEVIPVDGHTRAQQIVKISDRTQTLVFVADLLPTTAHLAPAWTMAYDVEPLVTIAKKTAFLEQAVEGAWSLFFEHDPEVAVANLERTEKGIVSTCHRSLDAL